MNRWPGHSVTAQHTTAFADLLQLQLAQAADCGARLAAMEVSSHALDYHPSMEAYFEAKALLFAEPLLAADGRPRAVVNSDDSWGARLAERLGPACWRSSLQDPGAELFIDELVMGSQGVSGRLRTPLGEGRFHSPLVGRFNLMNLLQAVAVLVDYAHTPDGLENALQACRPFTRGRLICVFVCGGDRDRSKRPQMGAIAARLADRVVVTSDNPRTEEPNRILDDVVAGIPADTDLQVEGDRAAAIATAITTAGPDDLVLIAGKGHEDYQILGTTKIHFDDREEAEKALRSRPVAV